MALSMSTDYLDHQDLVQKQRDREYPACQDPDLWEWLRLILFFLYARPILSLYQSCLMSFNFLSTLIRLTKSCARCEEWCNTKASTRESRYASWRELWAFCNS
jgi:hypothetical protein